MTQVTVVAYVLFIVIADKIVDSGLRAAGVPSERCQLLVCPIEIMPFSFDELVLHVPEAAEAEVDVD